jgi:hypothetical protein
MRNRHYFGVPLILLVAFVLVCAQILSATLIPARRAHAAPPGSLQFDGVNDILRTVNLPVAAQFTVEAWVKRSADSGTYQTFLSDANSGYSQAAFALYVDGGGADCGAGDQFAYYQTGGNSLQCSGATADVGVWHHVAVTRDGAGTRRFFVDGILRSSQSNTSSPTDSSGTFTFGRAGDVNSEYFAGLLDEVRVSSSAIYTANFSPPTTPLASGASTVALYHMDEGAGQTTADSSGNGRNGTLGTSANADTADPTWSVDSPIGGAAPTFTPTTVPGTSTFTPTPTRTPTSVPGTPTFTPTPTRTPTATPTPGSQPLGRWDGPFTWPIAPVHLMLQTTGEILMWDQANGGNSARIWNPTTNTFRTVPNTQTNLFCVGQTTLADGRSIAVGGHLNNNFYGLPDTNIYNPTTSTWTRMANMSYARWYPTTTTMPDGRVLAISGYINPSQMADVPEIYNPANNTWTALTGATLNVPMYSFMYVLPNGTVLNAGPSRTTRVLNVATQSWTTIGNSPMTGHSAVMYQPGRVMKSGELGDPDRPSILANTGTAVLDMNQANPAWRSVAPMAFPRAYHNLTLLPDGNVLVTGGETTTNGQNVPGAVYPAELWNPQTETWTTMAAMQRPRMYHSTALLLPDGRVLSAGGYYPPYVEANAEIYSPPYLFNGPRPTITSAPAAASYGETFFVGTPDGAAIASASLIRLGAVTHGIDMSQRFLNLSLAPAANGLNLQAPAGPNLAPPGYYMLFLLNSAGVPSVARIVQLGQFGSSTPTPTGTATSTPSATATRTATATSTPSATAADTATATATDDATPTDTATATETGTATSTATSTGTATSTATSTSTPTATPSGTPTSTATSTSTPSATPSTTPSSTATASATPGGANTALDFDGANDVARGPQIAGSTGTQTIEAWVRPDTNNQNALVVFHSDNTTGWSLELNNGQATFWVANPNGTWRFARNTNVTLTANTWYHIAATYSAGTARVYVNGNQGASASVGTISQGPMLRLGGISGFPFFNGQIDEVRISDVVRYSSAFTRPTAPFVTDSNTLALYHLNESSGQIASDSSGRGYTLTLGSGASADSADPAWLTSSAPIN